VVIVDDILATGGTVNATVALIEKLGGKVVAGAFLGELSALKGRDAIEHTAMKIIALLEM
jgi:adenine phosphoribosyltransferase